MNIFIVRHAESYNNTQGKMLSTTDLALTVKGVKQAEALYKSISKLFISNQFDYIFSSPLIRAVQTAVIVSKTQNIVTTDLLGEMNLGVFEGLTWNERTLMFPNVDIDNALSHVDCVKGESYLTVESRCTEFIHRFLKNIDENSNILITTHGITMRILTNVLLNKPREHVNYLNWAENTAITHIEYDNSKSYGKAICINNRQHLFSDELRNKDYESWGLFSKSDYLSLA
ncbi:MAG: pgm6 [Herbinix sp.]|jgi:probable phosphoglycerate mutase|nr:pgm6 [Herbinix sp.]